MQIFILDLDGTLLPSHEVDNECYWRAVSEVFGREVATLELGAFRHVTDAGILDQWCREQCGRAPGAAETRAVRARFLALLEREAVRRPDAFSPLPGVEAWLENIHASSDRAAAIATGGWAHTARFKVLVSGLGRFDLPLACSDDDASRTGIMRHALSLLGKTPVGSAVTYFGDGPWDLAAAQRLGWDFTGIASGRRAERLRAAGAPRVWADFEAQVDVPT